MLSFIKKFFKKEQKQEIVVKEEVDTKTPFEKYCSDNPESEECRIYDI